MQKLSMMSMGSRGAALLWLDDLNVFPTTVKAFNAVPYAHHWFEKTLGKKTQNGKVQ
jgi:hypothetical protein